MSEFLKIAAPIVLTYLLQMTMGLVDLLFMGRVGALELAAVGLGHSIHAALMTFGIGILSAMDYFVSKSYGERDVEGGRRSYSAGLRIASWLGVIMTVLGMGIAWVFPRIPGAPEAAPLTSEFLFMVSLSHWPAFQYFASRSYFQARGMVKPGFYTVVAANVVNAAANWVFVFGHFGFTAMGPAGSGLSTAVAKVFMWIALLWVARILGEKVGKLPKPDFAQIKALLVLGFPTGIQIAFEVGVFSLSTQLAGRLGTMETAAHQIVLTLASFTFMVPMGLSTATAVLVGRAIGERDAKVAAFRGWQGLGLSMGFMCLSATVFLLFPEFLLGLFTKDQSVLDVAMKILFVAAVFQVFDGAQVLLAGALRGLGESKSSLLANLFGHWGVGVPVGVYLCFYAHRGLEGIWLGLCAGLISVSIALLVRWSVRIKRLIVELPPASVGQ